MCSFRRFGLAIGKPRSPITVWIRTGHGSASWRGAWLTALPRPPRLYSEDLSGRRKITTWMPQPERDLRSYTDT